MIPRECKRLAEVDFPIAVVSKHASREKSIRHGHPSTLHLWWARRPLASSRAVLLALLLPDPCDPHCPDEFRRVATRQIRKLAEYLIETKAGSVLLTADLKSGQRSKRPGRRAEAEREAEHRANVWRDLSSGTERWTPTRVRDALLQLLAQGSAWEWSGAELFLSVCRSLVRAAHGEEVPLVVDPFAGGGSIPLEALRLGCETFASDLNPVACLILKVMLEDIPRHGPKLAEELRRVGGEIKATVEKELADLYPADPGTARYRSPISGRVPCVVRRRTVGRRPRSCARSGCARRTPGSGRSGTRWNDPTERLRGSLSRYSSRRRTRKCRTVQ